MGFRLYLNIGTMARLSQIYLKYYEYDNSDFLIIYKKSELTFY